MTKHFSILDVYLGKEESNIADELQYKTEQWKKNNRTRRFSSRKNEHYQCCPDQSVLPYTPEKSVPSSPEDLTEIEETSSQSTSETTENKSSNTIHNQLQTNTTTLSRNYDFPRFSMPNLRNLPIFGISQKQKYRERYQMQQQQQHQHQHQVQQQMITNCPISLSKMSSQPTTGNVTIRDSNQNLLGPYPKPPSVPYQQNFPSGYPNMGIPRAYSTMQLAPSPSTTPQQAQIPRQTVSQPREGLSQSIELETFFINSLAARNASQQERSASDSRFLGQQPGMRGVPQNNLYRYNSPNKNVNFATPPVLYGQNPPQIRGVPPQPGQTPMPQGDPTADIKPQIPLPAPNQDVKPQIAAMPSAMSAVAPSAGIPAPPQQRPSISPSISTSSLATPPFQQQIQRMPTPQPPQYNQLLPLQRISSYNQEAQSNYQQRSVIGRTSSSSGQQRPQIMKTYFNTLGENNQWSVMYDPEMCKNIPLVFDKSDTRIKFTDVNSQEGGNTKSQFLKWDNMDLEDKQYHIHLFDKKDTDHADLRHSDPAIDLWLIEPNIDDFENFHHPKFDTGPFIGRKLYVSYLKEDINEASEATVSPFLKDLKSISGKRGGLVLVEHTSEALPFIMNVGMASRLIIYWHKEKPGDYPKQADERIRYLEPDQTTPFIAQIPRNKLVPTINCGLYNVPVAEHAVPTTDFLLVKSKRKPTFYIRKFNSIYCAGFLEPKEVVMIPGTKEMQDFHPIFIQAILINIFRGTGQYPGREKVQISQLQQEFFPGVNETKLRTALRQISKNNREQGIVYWIRSEPKALEEKFKSLVITPEDVCKYQSMLVGEYKLRKNGVNILTRSKRVYQQIQNLRGELTKKVANKIEIELMKTPWARTVNFSKAFKGHALQVLRADDGSQIMRSKSRRGKGGNVDGKDHPTVVKPKLAGTEKDLRALTLRELRDKLISLGVAQNSIDEMSRWSQVRLLRELANRQKEDGNNTELTENFSRGPRNDYAASLDLYKKQYQQTFETNLLFITTDNPDDGDEVLDDGNLLDDISLIMTRDDDEDNEEFDIADTVNTPIQASNDDPSELVPFGVFTVPTEIDWERFGFANTPMRTVAKVIKVSWNQSEGLHTDIHWIRSPPQIESLKRNPNVYQDQGQKAPLSSEDLEEFILRNQRKTLQDKIRRTNQAIRNRGPKTPVQSYLTVHHQLPLINDTGGNNLTFHLTPSIYAKIEEASERFKFFEQKNGKNHSKKKKSSGHGLHGSHSMVLGDTNDASGGSDYDSDEAPEVVAPSRRIGRQNPVFLFNELLKKLLAKLLQKPGDEYWPFKKPVLKKDVPDYHNYVRNPICFEDIERKANNLEYTTISKFYSDVKLIESNCRLYNSGRNEDLVALAGKMMYDFQRELSSIRDELDQRENEIDPVLRQNTEM